MKKILLTLITVLLLVGCGSPAATQTQGEKPTEEVVSESVEEVATLSELPDPIDTTKTYKPDKDSDPVACEAGVYSADCSSINASNLYEYLGREDVVYIDLRDYADYGQKHLKNFEVIPFFAYIYNPEVGTNPDMIQLYGGDLSDPVSNYEESDMLLEAIFPKDKPLFIMCQVGGRVTMLLKILEAKGYDMSKIYNIGGMGQLTDGVYKEYTTDTLEFKVDTVYSIEGLSKN
ncbi:MAG: rhodanese-like domain-containing protein [Erysipelotrichaceae bacterium]